MIRNRKSGPSKSDKPSRLWRLFCAIELPDSIRSSLDQYVRQLRELTTASASWTKAENIHLTLKFFGDVEQSRIVNLSGALDRATRGCPTLQIEVGETGTFPPLGPAKVLWIGVSDHWEKLRELHQSLEAECEREGFAKDGRPFHPHLTIARLRGRGGARELAELHLQKEFATREFEAKELTLFRSELSSAGSRYNVISRHRLGW